MAIASGIPFGLQVFPATPSSLKNYYARCTGSDRIHHSPGDVWRGREIFQIPVFMPRKTKSEPDAQWKQRLKLIEEYAALDEEVSNFKPKIFRHQKLRELILDWYPSLPAEEEATIAGATCDIVISSRDKIRAVTDVGKQKLYRLWGSRDFVARAIVLLKSLPDPKDEAGLYTTQAYTGPRHLRIIAKARGAADTAA